jgi:alpha-L-rhamnosidase
MTLAMKNTGSPSALSLCLLAMAFSPSVRAQTADGWITHPQAPNATPIVLHFRRELALERVPERLMVEVTADSRFILFVNGRRVASGPSTGSIAHWRYARVDLAPLLDRGHNVVAAVVWNFGEVAPLAQTTLATGFRMVGDPLSTGAPGWRVKIDAGHSAIKGSEQIPWEYYVASTPEIIDANQADWDWAGPEERGAGWQDAIPSPAAAARTLVADQLPPQSFTPAGTRAVVGCTQ